MLHISVRLILCACHTTGSISRLISFLAVAWPTSARRGWAIDRGERGRQRVRKHAGGRRREGNRKPCLRKDRRKAVKKNTFKENRALGSGTRGGGMELWKGVSVMRGRSSTRWRLRRREGAGREWKEKNRKTGKKRKREGDVERAGERGGGGRGRRMASM